MRRERRGGEPQGLVHSSMSEILKNTVIVELIRLVGAATQTFGPGGKHPRAATVFFVKDYCSPTIKSQPKSPSKSFR